LVNWFEVDYEHTFTAENDNLEFTVSDQWKFQVNGFSTDIIDVLDITNPSAPIRILGGSITAGGSDYQIDFEQQNLGDHRYLVLSPSSWLSPVAIDLDILSDLKNPSNEADYLVICYADFLVAIQPLVNLRINQGLRVKVVDLQDIYDEFNGGVFDPQAIQSFLAYTYSNWNSPAPSFVLLVGDGNYDFKNNYGDSDPNYVPPFLGEFDPWIGETSSDNRYVTVSGDDILPDMAIGRLPANTVSEVTAMVDKILSYEQDPAQGDWNTRLTFVADNADSGGNFPVLSDNIADNYLPPGYLAEKIYYGLPPYENIGDVRLTILEEIESGQLIVHYTGHGSVGYWASEQLLKVSSISELNNSGLYPLFLPMTCQEGYFIKPGFPSLAESLVRASDKGAIASWSPTGFGLSNGHDLLAEGLYQAFFDHYLVQFGTATNFAKYYLFANSSVYLDLIDTYMLFGDPAIRLKTNPTGVILSSFSGEGQAGQVTLNWETVNETWLMGFNTYRSDTVDGDKQRVTTEMIIAHYPGQMQGEIYQYTDLVGSGSQYYYWLELVQIGGSEMTDPILVKVGYRLVLPLVIQK
jgi:hypothetical protein